MTIELDVLEHAVGRAIRDGKHPGSYLRMRNWSDTALGRVIKRLHAKGAVRYEPHPDFITPIVTDEGRVALASKPVASWLAEYLERASTGR